MGADLFGSYAESTCAALVVAASCPDLVQAGWAAVVFPMEVSCLSFRVSKALYTSSGRLIRGDICATFHFVSASSCRSVPPPCRCHSTPVCSARVHQVSAAGILVCLVSSYLSTDLLPVKEEKDIERVSQLISLVNFALPVFAMIVPVRKTSL